MKGRWEAAAAELEFGILKAAEAEIERLRAIKHDHARETRPEHLQLADELIRHLQAPEDQEETRAETRGRGNREMG